MKKIISGFIIGILISSGFIAFSADNAKLISYFFSQEKQAPDVELCNLIDSTKSTLDIAIYGITRPNIVDSIVKAKKRGVRVRIITDKIQSSGKNQKVALSIFRLAKIPVKIDKHSGLMHLKMTIADKNICTTGSFNYTTGAVEDNDEIFVILRDTKLAQEWSKEFEIMWKDEKRFMNYN